MANGPSLRRFLKSLEESNELVRVKRKVSAKFEVAAVLLKMDEGQAVQFDAVQGYETKVVAGICGTRKRLFKALNTNYDEFYGTVANAIRNPMKPEAVDDDAPVKEVIEKPNLLRIPVLTHYERDAGPYITAGVVAARSVDDNVENVSIHRLLVLDENHLAIRIVPRHLYRICQEAEKRGKPVEAAISIGNHPAVTFAAASPPPFGVSEYGVANAFLRGEFRLTKCEQINAYAPADAEIVLEGLIHPNKLVKEGPFGDIIETYDAVREQPIIESLNIMRRRDYFYEALLPGGSEHRLLQGMPYEVKIWEEVRNTTPNLKRVALTKGGCNWLHCVVSLKKQAEGDGKNAVIAALAAHPSLKMAIAVDDDIDVDDPSDVEYAMATRFQADKGLVLIPYARGSSLDPSADQINVITAKMGIDATMSLLKPKANFERIRIPGEEKIKLEDYVK